MHFILAHFECTNDFCQMDTPIKGTSTNCHAAAKNVPNFNQRQFANIVTGVHYFEPVRKVGNKIRLTKHGRRPVVAKRTMSTKKVLYHGVYPYLCTCTGTSLL